MGQVHLFEQARRKTEVRTQPTINQVKQLFPLGQKVWTAGVNDEIAENGHFGVFVIQCLSRHSIGDWGNALCDEDKKLNDQALKHGDRILSAYEDKERGFKKIWIITEWDRSVTTVLFPHEY